MTEELPIMRMGEGTGQDNAESTNYYIWGGAATVTSAFGLISVTVSPEVRRVFVKVKLRWYGNLNLRWLRLKGFFDWQRERWRSQAQRNCEEFVPNGYILMVYYDNEKQGG